MLEISWVDARLGASEEELSWMELVALQDDSLEMQLSPSISDLRLEAMLNVHVSER
jgi:hypothetical protein